MSLKKKKIRKQFRDAVFERDGHKCIKCGSTDKLDAHHIIDRHDMINGGYTLDNGATLCMDCHIRDEKQLLGYKPEDLIKIININ